MAKPTLGNKDIQTVPSGRRRFLKSVGMSTALAGAVMTAACGGSDDCDTDRTTDADPTDPANRKRDRCDSD